MSEGPSTGHVFTSDPSKVVGFYTELGSHWDPSGIIAALTADSRRTQQKPGDP